MAKGNLIHFQAKLMMKGINRDINLEVANNSYLRKRQQRNIIALK